jgi:hypothetical protein
MKANAGLMLLFMVLVIVVTISGFYFLISDADVNTPKRAIVCENDGPTISFLIEEKTQKIIMLGEVIDPLSIKVFNQAAISAEWKHNGGTTNIFLDRISGQLDVETTLPTGQLDKQKFECKNANIKF